MRKLEVKSPELQLFQQYRSVVKSLVLDYGSGLSGSKPRSVTCLQKDFNVITLTTSYIIYSVGHLKSSVICKLVEKKCSD